MSKKKRSDTRASGGASQQTNSAGSRSVLICWRPEINTWVQSVVVPHFLHEQPPGASAQGSEGWYHVVFALGDPGRGFCSEHIEFSAVLRNARCPLLLPEGARVDVSIPTAGGETKATFSGNTAGYLSTAEMRLLGNSFEHVEDKAYNLIMPILSYWSYKYNVAVDIAGYEVLHECSQTRKTSMAILGQTRYLDVDDAFQLAPELRLLFAAFRKGLCANDVFYQALSFYKVIEGVGRLRAKRRKALLETGETPRAEREMFPSTLEAIPLADPFGFAKLGFTLYLGKKFSWAKEQFRPLIRNAIAHLDPTKDNGDVIDADSFSDWIQCREAVPIMWYMASNMLDSEIQHLAGSQNTANFGPSSGTHSRLV